MPKLNPGRIYKQQLKDFAGYFIFTLIISFFAYKLWSWIAFIFGLFFILGIWRYGLMATKKTKNSLYKIINIAFWLSLVSIFLYFMFAAFTLFSNGHWPAEIEKFMLYAEILGAK